MYFKDYMGTIDDEVLLTAFEECQECMKTGILPPGQVRCITDKWKEICGGNVLELMDPLSMMREIANEMARRYYEVKKKEIFEKNDDM